MSAQAASPVSTDDDSGGETAAGGHGGGGGGSGSGAGSAAAASAASEHDPLAAVLAARSAAEARRAAFTPSAIAAALDEHIIGQRDAKRAVAVSLRNRWRRHRLPAALAQEVVPKNILMVGPTGCGKTEIARRLAKLVDAPFVKVEATKYTELGFVGRDVEDIVKDLVEEALRLTKQRLRQAAAGAASARAEERILRALCGEQANQSTLESFRSLYRSGALDGRSVDVDLSPPAGSGSGSQAEPMLAMLERMGLRPDKGGRSAKSQKQSMTVAEARSALLEQEADAALGGELVAREALRSAQEDGIVFIDEIDKIVDGGRGGRLYGGGSSSGVSSEGVQRDLLPILEGCSVSTKHGSVSTEHVLFICSGAFHKAKPSDMLAELQGRLPIRVELKRLTADDFYRILTEPKNNMIRQHQVLLETEGVALRFTAGAVRAAANAAEEANRLLDDIGARRLHTVLERLLSDISYSAPERVAQARAAGVEGGVEYEVTEEMVVQCMEGLLQQQDLSKYVL